MEGRLCKGGVAVTIEADPATAGTWGGIGHGDIIVSPDVGSEQLPENLERGFHQSTDGG